MTYSQVIENLYRSNDLDDCITKLIRQDHRSDFKHDLFLIIYNYRQDFILTLYNTSGLTFFVVRTVLNLVNNRYGEYHKRYNSRQVVSVPDFEFEAADEPDDLHIRQQAEHHEMTQLSQIDKALTSLDSCFPDDRLPYYRSIIEEVVKQGGIRAASRVLNIPKSTIHNYVTKVRHSIYNDPDTIKGVY